VNWEPTESVGVHRLSLYAGGSPDPPATLPADIQPDLGEERHADDREPGEGHDDGESVDTANLFETATIAATPSRA
jgi:hypothetical protein